MKTGAFVILEHDWPQRHWDLLVDLDTTQERVATWSLDQLPRDQEIRGNAVKLADHRREYFEYEGIVGNQRGTVRRVVSGEFQLQQDFDIQSRDELQFRIESAKESRVAIFGTLTLQKMDRTYQKQEVWPQRTDAENDWGFIWRPGRAVDRQARITK